MYFFLIYITWLLHVWVILVIQDDSLAFLAAETLNGYEIPGIFLCFSNFMSILKVGRILVGELFSPQSSLFILVLRLILDFFSVINPPHVKKKLNQKIEKSAVWSPGACGEKS